MKLMLPLSPFAGLQGEREKEREVELESRILNAEVSLYQHTKPHDI